MQISLALWIWSAKLTALGGTKPSKPKLKHMKLKINKQIAANHIGTIHNLRYALWLASAASRPYLKSVLRDLEIQQSEHAALCAVAEAAKLFTEDHRPKLIDGNCCACCGQWTPYDHREAHDHLDTCDANNVYLDILESREPKLRAALANLEAVRKGE